MIGLDTASGWLVEVQAVPVAFQSGYGKGGFAGLQGETIIERFRLGS